MTDFAEINFFFPIWTSANVAFTGITKKTTKTNHENFEELNSDLVHFILLLRTEIAWGEKGRLTREQKGEVNR